MRNKKVRHEFEIQYGEIPVGYDLHHIVPLYMNGKDTIDNVIMLSREEHIKAHLKLYEEYKNPADLYAISFLNSGLGYMLKGIKRSKEVRENISAAKKGKGVGKDNPNYGNHKLAGKNNFMYGKTHSAEAREKIANAHLKHKYEIRTPNNDTLIVDNLNKFCQNNKLDRGAMWHVCNGDTHHHKGFTVKIIGQK